MLFYLRLIRNRFYPHLKTSYSQTVLEYVFIKYIFPLIARLRAISGENRSFFKSILGFSFRDTHLVNEELAFLPMPLHKIMDNLGRK